MTRIDESIKTRLLGIARSAIAAHLSGCSDPLEATAMPTMSHGGVFITLRRHGQLRGCIGTFDSTGDLLTTIQKMAVAAAHDPRFVDLPLSVTELSELRIEVSLLSPLEPIDDPLKIQIGRHGVYVRNGVHTGCFLPDVATEHGWDAATFLSVCCREKAGLDPLAWQQPETQVFVFCVEKCCER